MGKTVLQTALIFPERCKLEGADGLATAFTDDTTLVAVCAHATELTAIRKKCHSMNSGTIKLCNDVFKMLFTCMTKYTLNKFECVR